MRSPKSSCSSWSWHILALLVLSSYILAHPDDDLLFQGPDLQADLAINQCMTSIFLTSGDSGSGSAYAQSREGGSEAAYAFMMGVPDNYTEFAATFAGHPVLVRTLAGSPGIQKLYFRFPDGNMDGSGYAITGYQSLRSLYFGQIASLTTQPQTASFTYNDIQQALLQIFAARKPTVVRTLDYLSDFDGGDHADHIATGRIVREAVNAYEGGSPSLYGYMGYPVSNFAPTISTTSSQYTKKCDAFFTYTPFDSNECQSLSACQQAGRPEVYWLQRQYIVTPALATTSSSLQLPPPRIPTGGNVAVTAIPTVVSVEPGDGSSANALNDGYIAGYPANSSAEWASNHGGVGAWAKYTWPTIPQNVTGVVLYDRPNPNDWLQAGILTFSNSQTIPFTIPNNDGSATVINFNASFITSEILLTVTQVSASTASVGLAEWQVYGQPCPGCALSQNPTSNSTTPSFGVDLALLGTATASSFDPVSPPSGAIDGVLSGYEDDGTGDQTKEWSSDHQGVGATLTVTWSTAQTMNQFILYDRPNAEDWVQGGIVTFKDGSTVTIPALNNDGTGVTVNFTTKTTTQVTFQVTKVGPSTSNIGLMEWQMFLVNLASATITSASPTSSATATATPSPGVDLALTALATASSGAPNQGPSKAIDGLIGGYKEDGTGIFSEEWASQGQGVGATLSLTWTSPITMNRFVLYDRPNLNDQITSAIVTFADGSSLILPALPNAGSGFTIDFAARTSTSVTLFVTSVSSTTSNVGLSEWQIYLVPVSSQTSPVSISSSTATPTSSAAGSQPTGSGSGVDLALSGVASASSFDPVSPPSGAIDGVLNGYEDDGTGDESKEWSSDHQGVGATLTITWSSAQTMNQFVFYDRPNAEDWVQGGFVTFSDGSSVVIPALINNGSGVTVNFATKTTTKVTFQVTKVGPLTANIGLMEWQMYLIKSISSTATYSTLKSTSSAASPTSTSTGTIPASGVDIALSGTATASSGAPNQGPSKAIDGFVDGYKEDGSGISSEEWASVGQGVGATLTITWTSPVTINQFVLYDRPNLNDQITSGIVLFSDGSSIPISTLANDGSGSTINFSAKTTTSVTLTVTGVSSTTSNIGLSEWQIYYVANLQPSATTASRESTRTSSMLSTTTVSATTSGANPAPTDLVDIALAGVATASSGAPNQGADKAIDGFIDGYKEDGSGISSEEWASVGQGVGATLTITWSSPVTMNEFILFDRPNLNDQITSGTVSFSDGSSISIPTLANDGSGNTINFSDKTTTSVKLTVNGVSPTTSNIGMSEWQIYYVSSSGLAAIAPAPTNSSSSSSSMTGSATSSTTVASTVTTSSLLSTLPPSSSSPTTSSSTTSSSSSTPSSLSTATTGLSSSTTNLSVSTTASSSTTTTPSPLVTTSSTTSSTTTTTTATTTTMTSSAAPTSTPTAINLALPPTNIVASSTYLTRSVANLNDENLATSWLSAISKTTTLTLTWSSPITVNSIALSSLVTLSGTISSITVTFSDQTFYTLPTNSAILSASTATRNLTTLNFVDTITSSVVIKFVMTRSISRVGIAEIGAYYTPKIVKRGYKWKRFVG